MVPVVHSQGVDEGAGTTSDVATPRALMMIAPQKNARITPAMRAETDSSTASAACLAQRFGITEATVYKWKTCFSFQGAGRHES